MFLLVFPLSILILIYIDCKGLVPEIQDQVVVIFHYRPDGSQNVHAEIDKIFLGRRNSKCKDPEAQ